MSPETATLCDKYASLVSGDQTRLLDRLRHDFDDQNLSPSNMRVWMFHCDNPESTVLGAAYNGDDRWHYYHRGVVYDIVNEGVITEDDNNIARVKMPIVTSQSIDFFHNVELHREEVAGVTAYAIDFYYAVQLIPSLVVNYRDLTGLKSYYDAIERSLEQLSGYGVLG